MAFDSSMMQKVVSNLLSNALKFTPQGGSVEVRLSDEDGRRIRLDVSDTGIGIPEADLPFIFDRYYRSGNVGEAVGSVFLQYRPKPKFGDGLPIPVRKVLCSYRFREEDACVGESTDDGSIRPEDTFLIHSPGKSHIDKGIDPMIRL